MRFGSVIPLRSISIRVVVPNRVAIPDKVSPDFTVYVLLEALGEGLAVGVGLGEVVGLGVGLVVGVGETVGVGVGLIGAGVVTGDGADTLSVITAVEAPTFEPVGTLFAKAASTGIALGPDPLSAT